MNDDSTPVGRDAARLTTKDIGRIGGNTTKDRHGREHYVQMGRKAAQVLKERYGSEHYSRMALSRRAPGATAEQASETPAITASEAGKLGGAVVRERYGREHFVNAGQRGGATTKERYGTEHYARIGRIGGMSKSRGREKPGSASPQG